MSTASGKPEDWLAALHAVRDKQRVEEDRETLPLKLSAFVKEAWKVLKPLDEYHHNWHIEVFCEHLEAVTAGDILRLQFWVPPGAMKSLSVSIMWPVWEWTTKPNLTYYSASYDLALSWQLCSKSRDLIESDWFQARWGDKVHLTKAGVSEYENSVGGRRTATAPGAGGVGKHGHRIILDDLLDASKAESTTRAKLDETNDWYDSTIFGRAADPKTTAQVLIMQRLHECLPPESRIRTPDGSKMISELNIGDHVLTGCGAQEVVEIASRSHTGEIIEVRTYGHCVPFRATENHRVLTTDGWVEAGNLTEEHILVFNIPTPADSLPRWPRDERRLRITAAGGSFTGARKVIPADVLKSLVSEQLTVQQMASRLGYKNRGSIQNALMYHNIERPAAKIVDEDILSDPDFWWMVGLWLAEGCVSKGRGKWNSVRWTLAETEQEYLQKIRRTISRYGLNLSVSKAEGAWQASTQSKQMGEFLRQFGSNARNKHLPAWVERLPKRFLREFFLGYWQGDGCLTKTPAGTQWARASSCSLDLIEGFQRILLRLDIAASVMVGSVGGKKVKIGERKSYISGPSWELRFPLSDAPWLCEEQAIAPARRKLKIRGDLLLVPIKKISRVFYDGEVWDIETPCHDFLTGLVTAHNSDIAVHALHKNEDEWTIVCLPERFESKHPYAWRGDRIHPVIAGKLSSTNFSQGDPREEGDLLWPNHRGEKESEEFARGLTSFRAAGQLQQRPAAREGEILKRDWWRFYDDRKRGKPDKLPRFSMVVVSVDCPLKDKQSSDLVAIQCYGVHGGDRYLLDLDKGNMNFNKAKRRVKEMAQWARKLWPYCGHYCLIENAGYGPELILDLKREIPGVQKISVGAEGDKIMRAEAASSDLESGNIFLPGFGPPWQPAFDEARTPADVTEFINNTALFPNAAHDDDVDAWSMAMNWLRKRNTSPMRVTSVLNRITAGAR